MSTDTPRPASGVDCDRATFGQQLLAAFDAVADVPPAQREAAIQSLGLQCPELERELRALLDRDARTGPLDATLSGQIQPLLQEALPELDPAPAQIGPYAVLRLLGEGGMGRVYLARRSDGPVSRDVAIKLIRPDRAGAGLLARFEAERRHLAALDHPGICRFVDADSLADGTPYVVMEAVQGEPIIDYCQRHGLGLGARVELLRTLLAAVAHAHDRLLLHRDIKPHNVLVTADGQPKLLDFGIAKSIEDAQASVTRTAERFFTPNASAPEQLLGEPAGVACDVYSLGALAYELLSGALPFDFNGLRAAEIERLVLQVAPPLMSERSTLPWARELKGDLDAIVATCLRKSPGERYRNVDALDAELQRWQEGRPVTARAPSWTYRSRLFIRRHRTAVGLSAALILAIAAFGSGLVLQSIELREQRNLAVIERDRALQVVEILESAFRNADPGQSAGDKVTARQILDAAVPSIEAMETEQPALFARMGATLARVELSLNQWEKAARWVDRSLAVSSGGETDTNELETLLFVGVMSNSRLGNSAVAGEMLNRLRALSPRNALEAELANARYLRSISKIEDAVKALELAKSLPLAQDSTQEAAHTIRWLLAELLAGMGEYARAEATLDETIKWQGRSLPPEHPRLLISAAERLRLLARIRPSPMLADEIEELLPITESTFGAGSLRHIFLKSALGTTLFNSGNTQDGLKHLLAALSAHTEALSPNSLSVIQAKIHATSFLLAEGSEESTRTALQLSESAAKDAFATFGNNAPISFLSRVQHCQSLAKLELWEATEECIHETLVFTDNARRNHSTRRSLEIVEITLQQSEFCLSNTSTEHCRK